MPDLAISLALCCLLVAGVLDVTLKAYSSKTRSRGALIFGIGVVWFVLQGSAMLASGEAFVPSESTLKYGVIAAVFVTLSNILLIESLARLPVSLASTIYRLNSVPLVILAVFFLAENLSAWETGGLILAVVAVLLLHQSSVGGERSTIWLIIVIIACCIRAAYGVATKSGLQNGADPGSMILIAAVGWCIGGPLYILLRERHIRFIGKDIAFFCVAGGVLVYGVVALLTYALRTGDASVVVPISNMGFVAALGIAVLRGLEGVNMRKLSGISCAVLAVVLLSAGLGE